MTFPPASHLHPFHLEASLPSVNNAARIMLKAMEDARAPEQERLKVLAGLYRLAGITVDINTALRVSAPHSPSARALMKHHGKHLS